MNKLPENVVVIDIETTGLDPKTCGILEIGAVKASGERFYGRVALGRGRRVESGALECNGIDPLDLGGGLSVKSVMENLYLWLRDSNSFKWIMVGKNPQFDYGFLQASWSDKLRMKLSDVICRRTIDLHTIAYVAALKTGSDITHKNFSTDFLYKNLIGMDPEPKPHNALRGALHEMQCLKGLLFGIEGMMLQDEFEQLMADTGRESLLVG